MELLKSLLSNGEVIAEYGTTGNYYCTYNCIINKQSDDIFAALEYTLHLLIDSDNIDKIRYIMGAYIPTDNEFKELQEYDEYMNIDLSYILNGLITFFNKLEV